MHPAIEDYEFLSSITGQMRTAATQGEWDHLVELEKQCSQRVARMKSQPAAPLDETSRQRKVALIRKILDDDAEIRNRTQPRIDELQRLLQGISQERRVLRAYSG